MCFSGYKMMVEIILELHKLPLYRTTQIIHLELPFLCRVAH